MTENTAITPEAVAKALERDGQAASTTDGDDIMPEEEGENANKSSRSSLYPGWESQRNSLDDQKEIAPEKRDTWKNSAEFILTSISSAVGLGNVWRFPFRCFENGGGAFLIPYFIVLLVMARPLYFMEAALGQFSSRGPTGFWDMAPLFRGVGIASALLSAVTLCYYVPILAYCCAYLGLGMADPLPWKNCDKDLYVNRSFLTTNNFTCVYDKTLKRKVSKFSNSSIAKPNGEMYLQYHVTKQLESLDDGIGDPIWYLTLGLFIMWSLICLSAVFGTKSSGKSAYFTGIFPYVVLIVLLIRACILPGAGEGLKYLFLPNFEKLADPTVWLNAMNQCFFSLGIGYGSIISFGSYNTFRQKISRDVMIVSFMDSFTSLLAAITVFAVLGVLAKAKGVEVKDVAEGGFGLIFISYPEVLLEFGPMPVPQIFSFLFFAMLVALGVGSATGYLYAITSVINDGFPKIGESKLYKGIEVGILSFLFFLIGISMTTEGGTYIITFCDSLASEVVCYFIVFFEVIGVAWIYGMKSFIIDIDYMTAANKNSIMNKIINFAYMIWGYCAPVILFLLLIVSAITYSRPTYKSNKVLKPFPLNIYVPGLVVQICMILLMPAFAMYVFFSRKTKHCYRKFQASKTPSPSWGPKDPLEKNNWIAYKQDMVTECWFYRKMIKVCCGKCHLEEPTELPVKAVPVEPEEKESVSRRESQSQSHSKSDVTKSKSDVRKSKSDIRNSKSDDIRMDRGVSQEGIPRD